MKKSGKIIIFSILNLAFIVFSLYLLNIPGLNNYGLSSVMKLPIIAWAIMVLGILFFVTGLLGLLSLYLCFAGNILKKDKTESYAVNQEEVAVSDNSTSQSNSNS